MSVAVVEHGDMLASGAAALVIPTNTLGVMGAGLAKRAAKRWPATCASYTRACRLGLLEPGSIWVGHAGTALVMLATKADWRAPSRIEWVERGLSELVAWAAARPLPSLTVPALGCGLGGLAWGEVRPRMVAALSVLPESTVTIYAPQGRKQRGG